MKDCRDKQNGWDAFTPQATESSHRRAFFVGTSLFGGLTTGAGVWAVFELGVLGVGVFSVLLLTFVVGQEFVADKTNHFGEPLKFLPKGPAARVIISVPTFIFMQLATALRLVESSFTLFLICVALSVLVHALSWRLRFSKVET